MVNTKYVNALMDTGAGVSVIDLGTLNQVLSSPQLQKTEKTLFDASRTKMDILGTVSLKVKLAGEKKLMDHRFYVLNSDAAKNVILGVDFMEKLGLR